MALPTPLRNRGRCLSLMPFADERNIVISPFALKPNGRRWKAFLAQRIHGYQIVTSRVPPRRLIGKTGRRDRIRRQPRNGILVPAAVHAIYSIADNPLFRIRGPFEMTRRAVLAAEGELR